MKIIPKEVFLLASTGSIIGAGGVILGAAGNPEHVGMCISCYISNLAGSLGLHNNTLSQFPRPELIGILLGAYGVSLIRKQHHPRVTGDLMIRFIIGFAIMIGCAVFTGCPLRALFRVGFGDFTVLIGISGLIAGVWLGTYFEKGGFYLKGVIEDQTEGGSWILPLIGGIIFIDLIFGGTGLQLSKKGIGAVHAPILLSLIFGIIIGALGQRSRYCTTAGIKNFILGRDIHIISGIMAVVFSAACVSVIMGDYLVGFLNYPGTHPEYIWDFVSMYLVGLGAALVDGCPFRIVIRAGRGDTGTIPVLMGMILAGGMTETLDIASSSTGISKHGKIAVLIGILVLVLFGLSRIRREQT